MKISEKLAIALNEQFELGVKAENFCRLRPSQDQRESGAFVWCFVRSPNTGLIGSGFTASECVKPGTKLSISQHSWGDIEVWAEEGAEL